MDDIIEYEEEIKESKLKKIIIMIVGAILILLFLSYSLLGYPVNEILEGQIKAKSIIGNQIELGDLTIIFENNTQIILEQIYTQEQEQNLVETSVCLSGYTQDNNSKYYISSLFYPEIYEQSFNHVNFESCPNDTLIMLHTHPYKRCLASKTDIKTLNNVKKNSPNTIMIVMCENNKFSVYS